MSKSKEQQIDQVAKGLAQLQDILNKVRVGTIHHTEREVRINSHLFRCVFGLHHGLISVYRSTGFMTNIQIEQDLIRVSSVVIPGKVSVYNLRKEIPIPNDVITDILSDFFPGLI